MIEQLFRKNFTRERHANAPLRVEREEYLAHLIQQGCCERRVRNVAGVLLNVVQFLDLTRLRHIDFAEIQDGSQRWSNDLNRRFRRSHNAEATHTFRRTATSFLHYHHAIATELSPSLPFGDVLTRYQLFLTGTRSPTTTQIYIRRVRHFLRSIEDSHSSLSFITFTNIDEFINRKRSEGAKPRTIGSICQALRSFFGFTYDQGETASTFADAIRSPRIARYAPGRHGPSWSDVRRLLASFQGDRAADVRARAMLFLFAIYALRISEVASLKLTDIDWIDETFTVRRVKNGRVQVFPLQYEVGEALVRYITHARPRCSSRLVFVTLSSPYRRLSIASVSNLVRKRMERLHIKAPLKTPHALRHACASELLHTGSSLSEIADFLGHKSLDTVSTYVTCSRQFLRSVSNCSLSSVL